MLGVGIYVCKVQKVDLGSSNRGACMSSFCGGPADAAKTCISCEECRRCTDRVRPRLNHRTRREIA